MPITIVLVLFLALVMALFPLLVLVALQQEVLAVIGLMGVPIMVKRQMSLILLICFLLNGAITMAVERLFCIRVLLLLIFRVLIL